MIYFTSDWHLGHTNVIKYCNRPFKNADEMDKTIIDNFNEIVKSDDTTYLLGDFCFHKNVQYYMDLLNGYKIFIWGNHDRNKLFKSFPSECVYEGYNVKIHMNHFPANSPVGDAYDLRLVGHVHEKWKTKDGMINVGVDQWDFKPVSIKQLIRVKMGYTKYDKKDNKNG